MKISESNQSPVVAETDERWILVQKICESDAFRRTSRVKELLLFITERALTNRPEALTEREIALGLFGRTLDHVTNDDTIVRSTARQLRAKLREYFEGHGRESPWIVEIPKGGYVPVFEKRTRDRKSVV